MTKKYEPTHAWVKELGLKGMFAEAADTAADMSKTLLANANPPDLVFIAVWLMLGYELKEQGITHNLMQSVNWWQRVMGGDLTSDGINVAGLIVKKAEEDANKVETAKSNIVQGLTWLGSLLGFPKKLWEPM